VSFKEDQFIVITFAGLSHPITHLNSCFSLSSSHLHRPWKQQNPQGQIFMVTWNPTDIN